MFVDGNVSTHIDPTTLAQNITIVCVDAANKRIPDQRCSPNSVHNGIGEIMHIRRYYIPVNHPIPKINEVVRGGSFTQPD